MKDIIIGLLLIVIGFIIGMFIMNNIARRKKDENVTNTIISEKLSECSDLTTCTMVYTDLVKYEQGSIPLVTKKAFSMIYAANIRTGVDLSQAKVDVQKNTVTVTLPKADIQSIEVDTKSLRFYDERLALFNWQNKEDISTAIAAAREDAENNINVDQLKARAQKQAETVVYQLIEPAIGNDRVLVVK